MRIDAAETTCSRKERVRRNVVTDIRKRDTALTRQRTAEMSGEPPATQDAIESNQEAGVLPTLSG